MDGEQALVLEAQQGDLAAFGQVYDAYFDRVFRYAFARVGNRAEAEDLAAEVFLKALRAIHSYRPQGAPFSAWLFRIAHNLVVDYLRRASRRPTEELEEGLPLAGPPPDEQVAQQMAFEDVQEAMEGITEAQRRVIALRFAGGLSIAEAAEVMGKSQGAIKALQHSAVQAVRRRLKQQGYNLDEQQV